jgi:hypothetical protein
VRAESVMSLKAANPPAKTGSHTRAPRSAATKRCRRADLRPPPLRRVRRRAPCSLFPPQIFSPHPPRAFPRNAQRRYRHENANPRSSPQTFALVCCVTVQ